MLELEVDGVNRKYPDIDDPFFIDLLPQIKHLTITTCRGAEATWSLYKSIEYIVKNQIPGDIVECGVWAGGSMLLAALALLHFGDTSRSIYLYDTFAGMPKPGEVDNRWDGQSPLPTWENFRARGESWGFGGTEEMVRELLFKTPYPQDKFVFVKGMVEDTLPSVRADSISLLRLDTDLYQSTYHELVHLYPRLAPRGVLMIDDYGFYQGSKLATDQYIAENSLPLFLSRVDQAVRLAIKPV